MNQVIQGDCCEVMKTLKDNSIDLTVTSPPYDDIRKYNGYTFDFEGIARELFRVTKQGGVVVWVVGDETKEFNETGTSFKQAMYFKDVGFNLLDTMIFLKKVYPPAYPSLKRYANQFEYMFILSKGKPNIFKPKQVDKIGLGQGKKAYRQKNGSLVRKDVVDNGKVTKNASNVWSYPVGGGNGTNHPAIFPEKLAEDHILSWSNEGDTVLDPMAGSGTTLKMAKKNGRNYIGIEISEEYVDIINKRISSLQDINR